MPDRASASAKARRNGSGIAPFLMMLANALVRDDEMIDASKLQKGQKQIRQGEASVSNVEVES